MASWFEVAGYGFQEFSAGGVRTFAIVEGRDSAFPLVLLHGTPGASFVWSTTIQAMGRSSRIIAPDIPGWGRSHNRVIPQTVKLSRDGLRQWLLDVLNAQQCEQCDLVGLGDGAWLAMDFLNEHPARVRRLGLLNLPLTQSFTGKFRWPWEKAYWTRVKLRKWMTQYSGLSIATRELVKPMFGELLSGGWNAVRSPEFPVSDFRSELSGYRDSLRGFDGDVMLGWGANAVGYDERLAAEIAQGRSILVWQEAANFPMWEQPEQFQNEMIEFFRT